MNIIIVGQGAMGLLWYHHIKQAINQQLFTGKIHLLAAKQPSSLTAKYHFTSRELVAITDKLAYAQRADINNADTVILCVKAYQVSKVLAQIAAQLTPHSRIILAHNGLGTLNELSSAVIRQHNIYTLLTTHGCLRSKPLTVSHTGLGTSDIGLISGRQNTTEQQQLTSMLNAALSPLVFDHNIKQKQWLKLAVNCVINPLTALNNIDNGQINARGYATQITAILGEIIAVAEKERVTLDLQQLTQTIVTVANKTAENSSSMRCDVLAERHSEIDYINGYIHKLGIKHDLATPENTLLWQQINRLDLKAKGGIL